MDYQLLKQAVKKKLCPPGYFRDKDGKCKPRHTYIRIGHGHKKSNMKPKPNGKNGTNGNGNMNGNGGSNGSGNGQTGGAVQS